MKYFENSTNACLDIQVQLPRSSFLGGVASKQTRTHIYTGYTECTLTDTATNVRDAMQHRHWNT